MKTNWFDFQNGVWFNMKWNFYFEFINGALVLPCLFYQTTIVIIKTLLITVDLLKYMYIIMIILLQLHLKYLALSLSITWELPSFEFLDNSNFFAGPWRFELANLHCKYSIVLFTDGEEIVCYTLWGTLARALSATATLVSSSRTYLLASRHHPRDRSAAVSSVHVHVWSSYPDSLRATPTHHLSGESSSLELRYVPTLWLNMRMQNSLLNWELVEVD
jgi:hypothetical protein